MRAVLRNCCLYLVLFFLLVTVAPSAADAQDRGEISVFGGYSYLYHLFSAQHGWNASVASNVTKHIALVADFSGHYGSETYLESENTHRDYSFLFGPRYVHTIGKRCTPFAHALIGNYRETHNTSGLPAAYNRSISKNRLALGFGIGLDIRVSDRISIRALQLDIVSIENSGFGDYYGRASFGAVFSLTGGPK
jgi:opacity protein-like surface antigen